MFWDRSAACTDTRAQQKQRAQPVNQDSELADEEQRGESVFLSPLFQVALAFLRSVFLTKIKSRWIAKFARKTNDSTMALAAITGTGENVTRILIRRYEMEPEQKVRARYFWNVLAMSSLEKKTKFFTTK
jgi:hypothetical protein